MFVPLTVKTCDEYFDKSDDFSSEFEKYAMDPIIQVVIINIENICLILFLLSTYIFSFLSLITFHNILQKQKKIQEKISKK